ncbi:hypothetical protein SCD_n02316 [Sulfuricella denitrificans skB26]|uniref:Uncharacterized protein n=1 Tax=Sulfuricella denitrificans (strain DSM 22764 / NBRC 105220 / skB26) TaxID=1163617 RepID=S6AMT0_SULDS|nr:hypothetical protein SCD_n02316 [Sulfuricella denitrificans skB26]
MHLAALTFSCGASFHLLGPNDTMLKVSKPVIAVVAARTGAGKSTATRYLAAVVEITKPVARVRFVAEDISHPTLQALVISRFGGSSILEQP